MACGAYKRLYCHQVGIGDGVMFFIMEGSLVRFRKGEMTHWAGPLSLCVLVNTLLSGALTVPMSILTAYSAAGATASSFAYVLFATICALFLLGVTRGVSERGEGPARAPLIECLFLVFVDLLLGKSGLDWFFPFCFVLGASKPICFWNVCGF